MLDLQSWSLGISGMLLQWKCGCSTHTQEPSFLLICFFWTSMQKHELFVWAGEVLNLQLTQVCNVLHGCQLNLSHKKISSVLASVA